MRVYTLRETFVSQSKSPYSVQIPENTDQKKLRIWTLFTQKSLQKKIEPYVFVLPIPQFIWQYLVITSKSFNKWESMH